MEQLTIGHPRWQEFIGRLEQRLNFRERSDEPGNYQWLCGKGEDPFAYTREVLTAMGFQLVPPVSRTCASPRISMPRTRQGLTGASWTYGRRRPRRTPDDR